MKRLLAIIAFLLLSITTPAQVMMWWDAHANFQRLGTTDSVAFYLQKCKSVGVTDIVVDVKPITGEVLFPSKTAPFLQSWKGYTRSADFDLLQTALDLAKPMGLRIHAAVNVFCGGHHYFSRGIIYQEHADWQTLLYRDSGMIPISQVKSKYSGMLNPANPAVQQYQLHIIRELVSRYPGLHGLVLDRVRFDGIEADFSALSRQQFEAYLGKKVAHFPEDIFSYQAGKRVPGPQYKEWLSWRAAVIYGFVQEVRKQVKQIRPTLQLGDYTGAWYPTYYEVGANWASKTYNPQTDYPHWANKDYQRFGYAELLDFYTPGCYFYEVEKAELKSTTQPGAPRTEAAMSSEKAPWYSVEGSAEMAMDLTRGVVPVWGGLYVEQYKNNAAQFRKAMEMCLKKTNGLMLFDLVHICEKQWWQEIAAVTKKNPS